MLDSGTQAVKGDHQIIHHTLERIEPEGLPDGRAEVGIRIDVVEDQPAVGSFQILSIPPTSRPPAAMIRSPISTADAGTSL